MKLVIKDFEVYYARGWLPGAISTKSGGCFTLEWLQNRAKSLSCISRLALRGLSEGRADRMRRDHKEVTNCKIFVLQEELLVRAEIMCNHLDNLVDALVRMQQTQTRFHHQKGQASQAISLMRLSVMASLFLPLSLGASILGIQTRFSDLEYRLFDYFCVSLIIAALTLSCWIIHTMHARLQNKSRGYDRAKSIFWGARLTLQCISTKPLWRLRVIRDTTMLSLLSALIAASACGMLRNVTFGLQVLGYSIAAAMAGNVLFMLMLEMLRLPRDFSKQIDWTRDNVMRTVEVLHGRRRKKCESEDEKTEDQSNV